MRRTEALMLVTLLTAVLLHQTYLAVSVLEEDGPGLDRDTAAPPDLWDPNVVSIQENDTVSNHDDHIFWMNDGWYYKKFDRFGNELNIEVAIDNQSVTRFISDKPLDVDANQDIHFVWVPGGYSGDMGYVVYDEEGNVLIRDIDSGTSGDSTNHDTYDRCISNRETLKSWWYI